MSILAKGIILKVLCVSCFDVETQLQLYVYMSSSVVDENIACQVEIQVYYSESVHTVHNLSL